MGFLSLMLCLLCSAHRGPRDIPEQKATHHTTRFGGWKPRGLSLPRNRSNPITQKVLGGCSIAYYYAFHMTYPKCVACVLSILQTDVLEDSIHEKDATPAFKRAKTRKSDKTNLCAEGSRAVGAGDGRRVGGRVVDAQFLCFPLHFCFMLVPLCCPVGNKMYVTMCWVSLTAHWDLCKW